MIKDAKDKSIAVGDVWQFVDELIARLIADGDGCNSKHGPGCDTRCKDIARRALAGGK